MIPSSRPVETPPVQRPPQPPPASNLQTPRPAANPRYSDYSTARLGDLGLRCVLIVVVVCCRRPTPAELEDGPRMYEAMYDVQAASQQAGDSSGTEILQSARVSILHLRVMQASLSLSLFFSLYLFYICFGLFDKGQCTLMKTFIVSSEFPLSSPNETFNFKIK